MINRRQLLATAAGVAALPLQALASTAVQSGASFRLAMTDITVRRELQANFAGTIQALRAIGYTHFGTRLRRYLPSEAEELPAADKARILKDAGMRIGAVRLSPLQPPEPQFEDAHRLGASVVVLPAARIFLSADFKPRTPTRRELEDFIAELNRVGANLRAAGLIYAYHNHAFDGMLIDGQRALDRMIAGTDPEKLSFEIDLAWAHVAGYDPVELVSRLGKRVVSLHLKDVDPGKGVNIEQQLVAPGEGVMNYRSLLPRIRALTTALAAVEVDAPADGMAVAASAFKFVRTILRQHAA